MFSESADLYDIIYSQLKDYGAEARQIADIVRRTHPGASRLLDVACGTGEHGRRLSVDHGFSVDGLDIDPMFVRIAAGKLPSARVYEADMTQFDLGRTYDVVMCLFSSIGYARTLDNVTGALTSFRRHLAPGGVIIVEPWFAPDSIQPGRVSLNAAQGDGISIARMSRLIVKGSISELQFEYMIGRSGQIERASETHELGLFRPEEMLQAFVDASLDADFDPVGLTGRGLYVARVAT